MTDHSPNSNNSNTVNKNTVNKTPYNGGGRNRTDDLLLAKQALYQLSYAPVLKSVSPYQ